MDNRKPSDTRRDDERADQRDLLDASDRFMEAMREHDEAMRLTGQY